MTLLLGGHQSTLDLAISVLLFVLHLLVMMRAITRSGRTPASRIAWVAVIAFVPLLGMIAYAMFGETSVGRDRSRRLRAALERMRAPAMPGMEGTVAMGSAFVADGEGSARNEKQGERAGLHAGIAPRFAGVFELAHTIDRFRPARGNRIELLGDPGSSPSQPTLDSERAIDRLISDIDGAHSQVHISFYIWLDDGHGGRVADAVLRAARRGVQCRVMVDALGSRDFIRSPRWKQMRAAGVQALASMDDTPRLGHLLIGRLDLRDHRKLAVIDGRIAYCGSQNCADPEFRVKPSFAPWVDMLFRCEGPIVQQAQSLFATTWIAETGEPIERVLGGPTETGATPAAAPGDALRSGPGPRDGIALMFATGPIARDNSMSDMFVACIYAAREALFITTPYFVPDESLMNALCAAPRRGVRTTLVVPARNDSRLVAWCCRSHYLELLESGVELFEYPMGLLHAKSLTADGQLVLAGSANMDRRSLQLNFENNLLVADEGVFAAVRHRQEGYRSVSRRVSFDEVRAWPFRVRLLQDSVGMMSPLL